MSEVAVLIIRGLQLSQWTGLASTTLLLYDHAITLADEVEYFWSGPWTFSRAMYFCIRYVGVIQVVVSILADNQYLSRMQSAFLFYGIAMVAMALCQIAITIRVWYMFAHHPFIRGIAINAYIASTVAAVVLSAVLWPNVKAGIPQEGIESPRTAVIAWLFVPSLLMHSLLFALKIYRFVTSPKYLQTDTFLWRFLKEGMVMYACALGSLLFIITGLTKTETADIPLYETALNGGIIFVTLTIVSVCRAMLGIKSLAATMHVDPGWLLNHAEMSRVHWRRGATEGEIVVEAFDLPVVSDSARDTESALLIDSKGARHPSGTDAVSSRLSHF